jgi:hypothetical protein
LQDVARQKGGECLSSQYYNQGAKLTWRCSERHVWEATATSVKHGKSWCPHCAGTLRLTIEEMQELARIRGGKCLSDKYVNSETKLRWECAEGHAWDAVPASVKHAKHWCPYCPLKNEKECRNIIESFVSKSFPKLKPKWLQGLELDGYCAALRLAMEYQGEQHYKILKHWHKNGEEDLQKQQDRDRRKLELCHAHGVQVVVIPYWIKDKREFIRVELLHIIRLRRHALTKMSDELAEELYPSRTMTDEIADELCG